MKARILVALVTLGLVAAACGSDDSSGNTPAPTAAPTTAAPATDAPTTDAPTTDAPTTDAPTTDPPTTDPPTTDPPVAPLDPPVHLTLSLSGVAPEAGFYIAIDKGYFEEEGLDVEVVNLRRFAEALPLLATGGLDLATGGLNPDMFNAVQRDVPIKIIAANATASPGSGPASLIVRQQIMDAGEYSELSDLAGMKIAINGPGSSSQFHVERILEAGGLTKDDIEFVVLGFADMPAALTNGAVDAVFSVEPFAANVVREGFGEAVAIADEITPNAINQVLVISPVFAERNAEAAQRFVYAFLRGQREYLDAFINGTNPDGRAEIIDILTRHTAVTDPAAYEGIGYSGGDPNGGFDLDQVAEMQDFFVESGTIDNPVEDLSVMVDLSYLEYAVERLGRQ